MAVKVTRTFAATQRGVGKPDYTKEISLGRERPGIHLKFGEELKGAGIVFTSIPSPVVNVKSPLAPGATAHLIDSETGFAFPYTILAGYIMSIIQIKYSFSQDAMLWGYFDGYLFHALGAPIGGGILYLAEIIGMSTALTDPTGATSHTFDFTVVNKGGGNLEGGISVWGICKMVGTQSPSEKKAVKCKSCNHQWEVPRQVTTINCPKCGQLNMYIDLSRVREI